MMPVNLLGSPNINLLGIPITLLGHTGLGAMPPGTAQRALKVAIVAGALASAYHGAKRHGGSVGWGLGWGILGGVLGPVMPIIGLAQGFGKCKFKCASGVSGTRRARRRQR